MNTFIGREHEISILKHALTSNAPELIAVYGRRRVGKTFLVRYVYDKHLIFEIAGMHKGSLSDQLKNFFLILSKASNNPYKQNRPESWLEGFNQLQDLLPDTSILVKNLKMPCFDYPMNIQCST